MSLAVAELISNKGDERHPRLYQGGWVHPSMFRQPVETAGNSIIFRPLQMELNRFYMAELLDKPYLYRRVSDVEVEVYGLAE